jgi:dTDP-4-dehydrorhamnose reductase
MLGHKIWQAFRHRFEAYATVRQPAHSLARFGMFDLSHVKDKVSVQDLSTVTRVVADVAPDVVVNCIGIVKQDAAAQDPIVSISVNALFPHQLAQVCKAEGARLIHISTDCIFSGRKGDYRETDTADAEDLYGRTKLLGELDYENSLTLRTSLIGRELHGSHGLIEWFLGQEGKSIRGFKKAVFSGFTTRAIAEIVATLIDERPGLCGVWHVAAQPINKFDLLSLVRDTYRVDIEIEPDEDLVCDRSLNGERFWSEMGSRPPTWPEMIREMHKDPTPYQEIRRTSC